MFSREKVLYSAACIQEKTGVAQAGSIGLILGSGLGAAMEGLKVRAELPYSEIEGFPCSTVIGHAGKLLLGEMAGKSMVVMSGRVHLYEGFDAATVCMPVRVLKELGVNTLIMTNAAGSLNHAFLAGSLMLVDYHINFTGQSPLSGPNEPAWGPRFPDGSRVYSPRLRDLASRTARKLEYDLHRGVYMQVAGPQYETPAETRALRM
ncbi:MAG: purine-nucleoside phosphorylase, partial [Proteobacteria bacterium]|nr:purine-nucleoside phosphorylase [Pseudomonadota bacterium]